MKDIRPILKEYLDKSTPEELRAELERRKTKVIVRWWRRDRYGWPIETIRGRPISSFVRIIFQNFRKIFRKF